MLVVLGHTSARAKPEHKAGFLWEASLWQRLWCWLRAHPLPTGASGDAWGEQPSPPGQPTAGQDLAWGDSFQEGSPVQLSRTRSLAPGANFQELLAAWESLGRLHVSSLLRSLFSTAELPLPSLSIPDGTVQAWRAALQHAVHPRADSPCHGDWLPALPGTGRMARGPCSTWASEAAEGTTGWERAWAGI